MIRKWRTRVVIYVLITVFLVVIGYYLYAAFKKTNDQMAKLKEDGVVVTATMSKIKDVQYNDESKHFWSYSFKIDGEEIVKSTITKYTVAEAEQMGYEIEIKYIREGNEIISYDRNYIDNVFKPWQYEQSILLWVLGGVTFAAAMYYVGRNLFLIYILKNGEESIGTFEEASHSKLGSNRYYKVKYSFERDGKTVTAVSPAYYEGREAEKLRNYGTFIVKYKGKYSVIDQKL